MDSLTQIVLGASVFSAICGRKYGAKAALAGAICGTIPDLDVFIDHGDVVSNFTMHRGFSHSLIVLTLISPCITYIMSKIRWLGMDFFDKRLHMAVWLAFITHPLLDTMTIYGTQLFWPIPMPPLGVGSIFIIDPLYTVPLIMGCVGFIFWKSMRAIHIGLILSTIYMVWTVGAQYYVTNAVAKPQLNDDYRQVIALPTPVNTLLWRIVVRVDNGYRVGYYSFFDTTKDIQWADYPSQDGLLDQFDQDEAVQRLTWFTKGLNSLNIDGDAVIFTDIRMGAEPDNYVFRFIVGQSIDGKIVSVPNESHRIPRDMGYLKTVWHRIWDEGVDLKAASPQTERYMTIVQ